MKPSIWETGVGRHGKVVWASKQLVLSCAFFA